MDGLPVEEKTGLPYASKKTMVDFDGVRKPVMAACGHDSHVSTMMGAATLLYDARAHWKGTLIVVFQPAEERLGGADAMVRGGLYDKVPKPDWVLAQHVMRIREGMVGFRSGAFLAAADAIDVRVFGKGGHGSQPHQCIDPVVIAASIVVRLQTVVSRVATPGEMAVVTCGSLQAGTAANIIPDHADLKLSVRTFDPNSRERILEAIYRIINAECEAGGVVEKPLIQIVETTPATYNDEKLFKILKNSFVPYFGNNYIEIPAATGSEDFSILATAVNVPSLMWIYGGIDGQTWDDAVAKGKLESLPMNHSPYFAPVIEPTLKTGVDAMALAVLTFLGQ